MEAAAAGSLADEARRVLARRVYEQRHAKTDLAYLISHMVGIDQRDGSRFTFEHVREPLEDGEVWLDGNRLVARDKTWRWQRYVVDRLLSDQRLMFLKGRQIGVTWVALAVDVAEALTMPDTASLIFRQKQDDAVDNIRRWWTLYQSLPEHLKMGTVAIRPDVRKTPLPSESGIALQFPDGRMCEIIPMSSAQSAGHGRSVRRIMLDEAAYIDRLADIRAATEPAAGRAKINPISTANGRSNPETGEGNEFHRVWVDDENGYARIFLPFDLHPDRDEEWYATAPEVRSLKLHQRQAQFPRDEHEAFALSESTYFEAEDLEYYRGKVRQPLYRADFVDDKNRDKLVRGAEARLRRWDGDPTKRTDPNTRAGMIRVYEDPVDGCRYAIGADPATGRGADFSAAYVLNLSTQAFAVEFHGHLDEDLFAAQLHYLGRMYGRDVPVDPKEPTSQPGFAKLAVENAGGYGNAVTAALRDRTAGRPAYGNLYRHVLDNRAEKPVAKPWGFPMNQATRPKAIGQLDQALRDRTLPWVTNSLLHEMEDFINHAHGTTPRAREGSHDDLVMAAAIALEMYRLYGRHESKPTPKPKRGGLIGLGRR